MVGCGTATVLPRAVVHYQLSSVYKLGILFKLNEFLECDLPESNQPKSSAKSQKDGCLPDPTLLTAKVHISEYKTTHTL